MTNTKRKDDKILFETIRKKPGMFIGEPVNVQSLLKFVYGYKFALINNNLDDLNGLLSDKPSFTTGWQ